MLLIYKYDHFTQFVSWINTAIHSHKSIKLPENSLKFMTSFNQDLTSIYFAQSENYYKKRRQNKFVSNKLFIKVSGLLF